MNIFNKENGLLRIHVYELRIGMCICRLEMSQQESSSLLFRFNVKSAADIQAIQSVCDYVLIDSRQEKTADASNSTKPIAAKRKLSFSDLIEQSADCYWKIGNLVKSTLDDVRLGNQISIKAIKKAAAQCVDHVLKNSDAMLLLTQLKQQDQYTAQHSMNVCIFSILLGRELKLPIEDLNTLALCALLHDIGKAKVPLEILNKPGKLGSDELAIMRQHPEFGRDILMDTPNIVIDVIDVAYEHHENPAGTGYPRAIRELSDFTKIVAIADAYDAITSDRVYQEGRPHLAALDILVKGMNTEFEAEFVIQFINSIGFYPQGSFVELMNGYIGIVMEQNPKDRLKPKILLIRDEHKNAIDGRLLDLSLDIADNNSMFYEIKAIVRPHDYQLDLMSFYQEGNFLKAYPVVL